MLDSNHIMLANLPSACSAHLVLLHLFLERITWNNFLTKVLRQNRLRYFALPISISLNFHRVHSLQMNDCGRWAKKSFDSAAERSINRRSGQKMNESGCGHVMESSDIFSTDRPWYNIKKYQTVLLAGEWFSSKKLPKFREPVQSRSLVEASNRIETSTKSGNTTISG